MSDQSTTKSVSLKSIEYACSAKSENEKVLYGLLDSFIYCVMSDSSSTVQSAVYTRDDDDEVPRTILF